MRRSLFRLYLLVMIGAVFAASPCCAQEQVLYSFPYSSVVDGTLMQASDGNFYGVANLTEADPICFKLTPSGQFTTLYTFTSAEDGDYPVALIEGPDGNLYGVSEFGGANNLGTVFRISLSGTFTTLYNFDGTVGSRPVGLVLGTDGNLYGSATLGGVSAAGAIFKVTLQGQASDVYAFTGANSLGEPYTSLLQSSDGNFYGASGEGGPNACGTGGAGTCGTIFSVSPAGNEVALVNEPASGFDVGTPVANLPVEGADGGMYDTVYSGAWGFGAFLDLATGAELYDFNSGSSSNVSPSGLLLASDGQLWGTSQTGGESSVGSIFALSTTGTLSQFYQFKGTGDGATPLGALLQGSDGSLYGFTESGGQECNYGVDGSCGVIYRLIGSLAPVQLSLSSSTIAVGSPVTLSWQVLNAPSLTMQQCYAFIPFNASGGGTWTGLQSGTMSNGVYQGSTTITPTAAGVYTYDLTCGGTESGSVILQVGDGRAATATTLPGENVVLGGVAMLTATTTTQQNIAPLTGSITFSVGTTKLGTVSLSNGVASLNVTASGIATGTYPVTATYSGDTNYLPSTETSEVEVLGYATSITLGASSYVLVQGQPVTVTATVARTATSGVPEGSVTFYCSTPYVLQAIVGSAPLKNGTATLTPSTSTFPPGSYAVFAEYSGDASDQGSGSGTETFILSASTRTTLTVTPNPIPANSAATLVAKVIEPNGQDLPTGTVTFSVGSYNLGSATLDNTGTATVNASDVGIAAGTYPVTATYSGDSGDGASTSAAVNVTVQ